MKFARVLTLAAVICAGTNGTALAVTPEELASLAKAGLGDEVLLALIESTGMSAIVDATGALALRRAGVSDRVIAAAIRASHPQVGEDTQDFAAPDLSASPVAVEPVAPPPPPATYVEREIYYVPWVVPARPVRPGPRRPYLGDYRGFGRFINDGFVDRPTPR